MTSLLYALTGAESLTRSLARQLGCEVGSAEQRRFPDEESYVRVADDVSGKAVAIVAQLDRPDRKLLPLLLLADTLRDLGAERIGLIAPYFPYMRQDTRFLPGEGISSRYFARILDNHFEWLLTVDPHLHRYPALDAICGIPAEVVTAAPLLADWIAGNVSAPLLIGPDSESEQWVAAVAARCGAPYRVLEKTRRGDRDVVIQVPDMPAGRTPVLIDDIISTGRTMIETVRQLKQQGLPASVCVAVHGIFADSADLGLRAAGAGRVVTANTVVHDSNGIDVAALLAAEIARVEGTPAVEAGPA